MRFQTTADTTVSLFGTAQAVAEQGYIDVTSDQVIIAASSDNAVASVRVTIDADALDTITALRDDDNGGDGLFVDLSKLHTLAKQAAKQPLDDDRDQDGLPLALSYGSDAGQQSALALDAGDFSFQTYPLEPGDYHLADPMGVAGATVGGLTITGSLFHYLCDSAGSIDHASDELALVLADSNATISARGDDDALDYDITEQTPGCAAIDVPEPAEQPVTCYYSLPYLRTISTAVRDASDITLEITPQDVLIISASFAQFTAMYALAPRKQDRP